MGPFRNYTITYLKLSAVVGLFYLAGSIGCSQSELGMESSRYWNHSDSVHYVGMATCGGCHVEIYQSFQHTGMGQSFGVANAAKSVGDFREHPVIRDTILKLSYQVKWVSDRMVLQEFSLNATGDTLHLLERKVDYIIGSGHHTNSHLLEENGYLYQMPFTFYSQKSVWDLPPGFENGTNSRFSRPIGLECMSCHNAMPSGFVLGSENKFSSVPLGIDCERCHGPGSAHVAKIMRGDFTDTANAIDYSIVNPKKLEPDLKFQICQRCHLQGNAVLAEGKSFLDFRPGMYLQSVMDVYLPRYENDPSFIMASHADRLKQSVCFIQSEGEMDCTTCHNPHVSVRHTGIDQFESACLSCHGTKAACAMPLNQRGDQTCVKCHMPPTSTADIPHVQVHDHKIASRPELNPQQKKTLAKFVGLQAVNNSAPTRESRIRAYLQQYERFEADPRYLDSLRALWTLVPDPRMLAAERSNFFYLSQDLNGFDRWIKRVGVDYLLDLWVKTSYDNAHAWAAFKTAEMLGKTHRAEDAERFYLRAKELAPFVLDFNFKFGNFLAQQNRLKEALREYRHVVSNRQLSEEAWGNMGYLYGLLGQTDSAKFCLQEALRCNPSYMPAKVNLRQLANR